MSEEFWQNGLKTIAAQVTPPPPPTQKESQGNQPTICIWKKKKNCFIF